MGVLSTKDPTGTCRPTWVAKSASWHMNDPLKNAKIGYMNGLIFQKFCQNWLKFKKILEKLGDFAQNLAQNWADWYISVYTK